ncbi:MAG: serine dehydratase subunit alpha family protein, partial [Phascolarctobacterium sp.]|nr:serine dehydratase subunit alpha family protein [Phascolarctobacterium sp.]
ALCAANAGKLLESNIEAIEVFTNAGIYKNGMSAGIPNCSKVGLEWAAALGAFLKNPEKSLELLADVNEEILAQAEALVEAGKVSVKVNETAKSLYVKCILRSKDEEVICIIQNAHTNIVHLSRNGEVLLEKETTTTVAGDDALVNTLLKMSIADIRKLVVTATEEELEFMLDGVAMNESLAKYSETREVGVGIAKNLRKEINAGLLANDLANKIVLQVASAAESRLDGCPLPTMSSSGAGTKGLVVILPVSETAKVTGASKLQTVQALAFAHLVNRYINGYVGKLSPMCSCVMCSSTAASAGITWLLGGNDEQIAYAIRNMCGTVTGMLCDGGKVGCALKVSTGSFAALMSAIHAVNNVALRVSDGICAETAEQCIKNMARIGNQGMKETDAEILAIMTTKNVD